MEKLSQHGGTETQAQDCDDQQAMKHKPLIIGVMGRLRQLDGFLQPGLCRGYRSGGATREGTRLRVGGTRMRVAQSGRMGWVPHL